MKASILFFFLLAGSLAGNAFGAQFFDDLVTFMLSTGAVSEEPIPNLGIVPGQSQTVGNLTYSTTSQNLIMGTAGTALDPEPWTTRLPGNQIAISGIENLDVDLSIPTYAIGFDFVEPENDPNVNGDFVDSTFTVTLLRGSTFIDSFTFNAPNDVAAFAGYWADGAFDRIEIRETIGGNENEFFGQFYVQGIFIDDFESGDTSAWSSTQ